MPYPICVDASKMNVNDSDVNGVDVSDIDVNGLHTY